MHDDCKMTYRGCHVAEPCPLALHGSILSRLSRELDLARRYVPPTYSTGRAYPIGLLGPYQSVGKLVAIFGFLGLSSFGSTHLIGPNVVEYSARDNVIYII